MWSNGIIQAFSSSETGLYPHLRRTLSSLDAGKVDNGTKVQPPLL